MSSCAVLDPASFAPYIARFNQLDDETIINHIPNARAWSWLQRNIPFFECPDPALEEIYYFRWWTYRKALRRTLDGFVILEFLLDVPWAGKYNAIAFSAGLHLYEGRWLRDPIYLDSYTQYWYGGGGDSLMYPTYLADAVVARARVTGDFSQALAFLDEMVNRHRQRENTHQHPSGLFWSHDNGEGELSISGMGFRPTLNSYMYGDAVAIAEVARIAGNDALAREFAGKADALKRLVQTHLWDEPGRFFKVLPLASTQVGEWFHGPMPDDLRERAVDDLTFAADPDHDVRELYGYAPYFFSLPDPGYEDMWLQFTDPDGFDAAYGPTTAERRHPRFMFSHGHDCLWNGPSWPANTSQALTAMANLLNNYKQQHVNCRTYLDALRRYAQSQHRRLASGETVPWIDENLHPDTGEWLARSILQTKGMPETDRGKDYNHSTFCDLVISGLIGLRPRTDAAIEVNPLLPADAWDYFCLDAVPYHGRRLTILYDRTGERYGRGRGLKLLVDGSERATRGDLGRLVADGREP